MRYVYLLYTLVLCGVSWMSYEIGCLKGRLEDPVDMMDQRLLVLLEKVSVQQEEVATLSKKVVDLVREKEE